jgi:hypothetical protein
LPPADTRNPPFAPFYKRGVGGISEIAFPYPKLLNRFSKLYNRVVQINTDYKFAKGVKTKDIMGRG